jgi:Tol biopolymer transport system component
MNRLHRVGIVLGLITLAAASSASAQTTTRVGVASDGAQLAGPQAGSISADGRYVAFSSYASTVVAGDTNGASDVFVRDLSTGQTTRVSVASDGSQGNGDSSDPVLSADGRIVVFRSSASHFDGLMTGGLFVHDRQNGQTARANIGSNGTIAIVSSTPSSFTLSASGRYVAFASLSSNIVVGDTNDRLDVFVRDLHSGVTTRESVASNGAEGEYDSDEPSLSGDGRFVAFVSRAGNLAPGDTNGADDVFVRDRLTGQTTRVSVATTGAQSTLHSDGPNLSESGRYVVFSSQEALVPGDTNGTTDIFVHDRQTAETTRVSVSSAGAESSAGISFQFYGRLSATGRYVAFTTDAAGLVGGDTPNSYDVFLHDRVTAQTTRVSVTSAGAPGTGPTLPITTGAWAPSISADGRSIAFVSDYTNLVAGDTNDNEDVFVHVRPPTPGPGDSDGDELADEWETRFGLDPTSLVGADGGGGDADRDGISNLRELALGTHPRGFVTRYLAEGATGTFFDSSLALLNPGDTPASVVLRFLVEGTSTVTHHLTVPPGARRTINPESLAGLEFVSFSTVVESDALIVVDRTMTWGDGYGSHAETALAAPSTTWYLAEGATGGDFQLFYLLQNPNDAAVSATVRYLRPDGLPSIERTYSLPANSRTTIYVNKEDPQLAATDVSAVVTTLHPIIVERAMYLNREQQPFAAGHNSAGVTAPALEWFLAEGATGPFFDLFVLIANPNPTEAQLTVDYLLLGGGTLTKSYTVPANGRYTIYVDSEELPAGSGLRPLAAQSLSTIVRSTNNVPVIAERAMWWPGPEVSANVWYEAHNSPGATATGTKWALADGEVGGTNDIQTYVLIANTSTAAGSAKVTLHFEDGTMAIRTYNLSPSSRTNIPVSTDFPGRTGKFGVVVESLGTTPVPIVVERAMYSGQGWIAGTNAMATRLAP